MLTSGAALLAATLPAAVTAAAPAATAGIPGAHLRAPTNGGSGSTGDIPVHVLPAGSGFGSGTWQLPATGMGWASAEILDPSGRLRYVMRANLVRSGEIPPIGMPEQGGFLGVLLLVEGNSVREPVATIEGKWYRELDGSGAFGVDILVPTEHLDHPMVDIGTIQGVLRAPRAVSQVPRAIARISGSPKIDITRASTLGRLALTWVLSE
jgi:hypothetical protein